MEVSFDFASNQSGVRSEADELIVNYCQTNKIRHGPGQICRRPGHQTESGEEPIRLIAVKGENSSTTDAKTRTETKKFKSLVGAMPLIVQMQELQVRVCFCTVENLAVDAQ